MLVVILILLIFVFLFNLLQFCMFFNQIKSFFRILFNKEDTYYVVKGSLKKK